MKSKDIEYHLVCKRNSVFNFRKYNVVANLSFGFLDYEADLFAMNNNGYCTEIEIKISVADLKNDLDKDKFKNRLFHSDLVKNFYYAMPISIWDKIKESPPIISYAGVYVIHQTGRVSLVKKCIPNKNSRKLSLEEQLKLLRLGNMRYWTRRELNHIDT